MNLLTLITTALCAITATSYPLARREGSLAPTDDPFYSPPDDYEDKPLGTILKSRKMPQPPGFVFLDQDLAGTHQILYRTSNTTGGPVATVATILVPYNANFSRLLAYSVAEDAAWLNCAPSYTIQYNALPGGVPDGIINQAEILIMDTLLNHGIPIVTSDYEGPQSAFAAGFMSGHGVLDSIRAALQSEDLTGIKSDADVQLMGYSGGSLASGWAAKLQPSYYPELDIKGVAVGGLVANLTHTADFLNKTPFTGLVLSALAGLSNEYPELKQLVDEQIKDEYRDRFKKVFNQCAVKDVLQNLLVDWYSWVKTGKDIMYNKISQKVLHDNSMVNGEETPKAPMMIYHGKLDEIIPYEDAEAFYDEYCSRGVDIELNSDLLSEHGIQAVTGVPLATSWLLDRFNGKPVKSGCQKNFHLTNALDKDAIEYLGSSIFDALTSLLGKPIGPDTIF